MTTPDLTAGTLPQDLPRDLPPAGAPPEAETPPGEKDSRRRRKVLLIVLLGTLVSLLLIIALWYLIFRKPISILPIPPAPQAEVPAFSRAIYDLTQPLSVAVTADGGRLFVTQSAGTQETLMLDAGGTRLGVLKPPSTITGHATQQFVALDPVSGQVYASDRMAGAVYVYSAQGAFERRFEPGVALPGWQPLALAFDAKGDLFVSDVGGAAVRIHEFGRDGKLVRDFGATAGLSFPNGLAIDGSGRLYVSDTNNGRLLVFDSSGAQVGVVGRGPAAGELGLPVGIVIDDRDRVFVVDSVSQAVQVYRVLQAGQRGPAYLASFGREGTVDGAFEFPNGIALDARGRVYVADWNNNRVQVWSY